MCLIILREYVYNIFQERSLKILEKIAAKFESFYNKTATSGL